MDCAHMEGKFLLYMKNRNNFGFFVFLLWGIFYLELLYSQLYPPEADVTLSQASTLISGCFCQLMAQGS